ncbi:DeoR/GlpR family DNA-binding transcription regulator [Alsobacter sp. R-9]
MSTISQRQKDIVALARSTGRVSVEDLAARFDVSPQTIRKDLNDLCDQRLMSRVHGGAVVASGVENLSYEARRFIAREQKVAIGKAAAALVPNGASLFINIGTTTEEVAKALADHEGLLVITNNLHVAATLYPRPRIEVIVAGGPVRRSDGGVVGSAAVDLIGQFKVDYAVVGTSAIDPDGALLDFDYQEVRVSRAIIGNARHVILVADRTKLDRSAPVRIGHLRDVGTLVTDHLASDALRDLCRREGIRVVETGPADDASATGEAAA